jgi:hypothetical protein
MQEGILSVVATLFHVILIVALLMYGNIPSTEFIFNRSCGSDDYIHVETRPKEVRLFTQLRSVYIHEATRKNQGRPQSSTPG